MTFKEYIKENLEIEASDEYIDIILDEEDNEVYVEELDETITPLLKRKINRAKREELMKMTKGQFFNWDVKERARFLSKWSFLPLPGGKGKFVRRQKPIGMADMIKKLKKASKTMRLNKRIRQAGLRKKAITKGIS